MTRFVSFLQANRISRGTFSQLLSVVLLAACFVLANSTSAFAQSFVGPMPLTLLNGWTNYSSSTAQASVEVQNGTVQFRGAIASGTTGLAFTLPKSLRPNFDVYVPVDLCNAAYGRLWIQASTGNVTVEEEGGGFTTIASCFTSLDGASFAQTAGGYTPLTLINGWANGPFGTSSAAVSLQGGIVHFKGAISTSGTNTEPFVLPAGFRPLAAVYITVDLCNANKGRLNIGTDGTVNIEEESGGFTNAPCFTSLDGAWFNVNSVSFIPLTPINGWNNAPFSTGAIGAGGEYGIVYFKGAISTSGTNSVPFNLQLRFRPVTTVYVPVDMCDATKGRLIIAPNGTVTVEAETSFSNAACFTSLDGVSFVQ